MALIFVVWTCETGQKFEAISVLVWYQIEDPNRKSNYISVYGVITCFRRDLRLWKII